MNELTGWILDIYSHPARGIVLWLLCDDGQRCCLHQEFRATFYARGASHRLRDLWKFLGKQPLRIDLSKDERRDLFAGETVVLAASLDAPYALPGLFQTLTTTFPDLTFYDADLHVALRHAAIYGTFPLARCHVETDDQNQIHNIKMLDSRWDIDSEPAPLRILTLDPDVDPFHNEPKQIYLRSQKNNITLDLKKPEQSLAFLSYVLKHDDPDLIITSHGDRWMMPLLLDLSEKHNRLLPFNRDPDGEFIHRKERSYYAYNQVIYRGAQIHLAGRLHLDIHNTVMYGDYGVDGVLEMARLTSLPVQTAARVSPGTGISAMQIRTALEQEILVPLHKGQVERAKTSTEIFEDYTSGLIYDPIIGLHEDVAELDFFSMYPAIMTRFNISPETVGGMKPTADLAEALETLAGQGELGLIPRTLLPLLEKRFAIKALLLTLSKLDCRYKNYKAKAAAQKWLLVTCFGYLGYKNARFGRIEAHEAVTAYGREVMLRSKEAAEDMGFRVLHIFTDGMWVQKSGCRKVEDFQPLLAEVKKRTSLPLALEEVYKWIVFPPSKQHKKIAVPNRYFGVFKNGDIKTRGIETRRHDTPAFIKETQMQILEILARAPNVEGLKDRLKEVQALVEDKQSRLRSCRIPPEQLIIHQTVSRTLEEFRSSSSVATALKQLDLFGKTLRPGQPLRFVYTLGIPRAIAWDLPTTFDPDRVNIPRYTQLLGRAVDTILEPIMERCGVKGDQLTFDI